MIDISAPTILNNLAELMVSPQYTCQVELSTCNREWYTRNTVQAYADRVLASKPSAIADDNFINDLYE